MSCLFASCFGKSRDGYGSGDSAIKTRRVLVRTSLETEAFSFRRASSSENRTLGDEKVALHERDSLMEDVDEDAEEQCTYMSEKQLEAGEAGEVGTLRVESEMVQTRHLTRRSIGWKRKKKPSIASPDRLLPHNTGDELHRRAEYERRIKAMNKEEARRAWNAEKQRRQQWEAERRSRKGR